MKVSELTEEKLAYWVAKAQGWAHIVDIFGYDCWDDVSNRKRYRDYRPDINWSQCGELIERFYLEVFPSQDVNAKPWCSFSINSCSVGDCEPLYGDTPQEAICRAVVGSVYGEEVVEC